MKIQLPYKYCDVISVENLLLAWQEFILGKRNKPDVQKFSLDLMDNVLLLHHELANHSYEHGSYQAFNICDPKPRHIHKASVRDRLVHHAVYHLLYPFFDKTFIADSFSCRIGRSTHKAINRFREFAYQVSQNNTKTCWVLKCDAQKFFASIDQAILLKILQVYIPDRDIMRLLQKIIKSFTTAPYKGLPLGNLTSQLFANVYLNEFDQFVKHHLKVKYYIRYADDFVVLSSDRDWLRLQISLLQRFLEERLYLILHPQKILLQTLASGIDFLGWVHFPHHRVLRTTTKQRMMQRLKEHNAPETVQSYLGLLRHGNTFKMRQEVMNSAWLWSDLEFSGR
ncbi:reverse transcriptase/maturase family protein [Patescibacteria group bacterium]|nr:reverse transcriptase/maturase family protein [Patescibacteria group bacterium]MBU4512312.1 reverse transcriptase/maturase family protein [Patescibacteria group bacterium]MCG2692763.1 reverse transcriptase/maturase family protein [Candidatus Parcubacteria bacterium]